jgi:hypothetical protein
MALLTRDIGVLLTVGLAFVACSTPPPSTGPSALEVASPTTPTATLLPTSSPLPASPSPVAFDRNPAPIVEGVPYQQTIDPASFVDGIDNPFFPFSPGATYVYEGDERVEVTVLTETKAILGVAATVVSDKVFADGELVEDTLDYYAQDRQGNVWYMGEQTAEYENGKVASTAGSWEAGVNGAQPGIVMLADPRVGDEYRQEYYVGEAEDLGAVTALTGSVESPAGKWAGSDVLVTEEWTPLEPDIRERKTYARGVGLIRTERILGGAEVTTLSRYEPASG